MHATAGATVSTLTTAENPTIELHYEDSGGPGRPVVLIHGWPLSGEAWAPQVPALTEAGYRVITYDRRGFGQSSTTGDDYDYDTLAADLRALVQGLELHDAVLVGFSMGGGEVARYVGRFGDDDLAGVVFAAAVTPCLHDKPDNPSGPMADEAIEQMRAGVRADKSGFLDGFTTTFFSADDTLMVSEEDRQAAMALGRRADADAACACVTSFSTGDFRNDISRITVPTLVIHGDSDAIVPLEVSGALTHKAVENSTLHVVTGGPHGINTSHPEEFNQTLLEFLGGL